MKERENLYPEKVDDEHQYLSPASYTLSKEEKESMFEYLNCIKVPSGLLLECKGDNKCGREEIPKLKVL
jgi:hypothetical protein